ncbi:hypothetical protein AN286_03850 [Aliarcobacter cryaerophilus ATCC 43158]|uniref:Uncharacterized protein n=1 Tax=Aliarcobacter cryaerophilus ATCC 43158 TaxID=1032070 RepID=A0AAD0TU03_9BACT|nr:hypothetical protein [Aliarcobacter cryaerophilus]AYJ79309.1 hypothetical protein ACRYA_0145 [Aliarcobacter cryaerophilus ATCC 43158]PRM97965.1 hypothetical protein CJ667_03940 [Aliarcobacter cryaerophilus]QCZ23574.1 hypothetical protein AN286_03850 [Aliarcobacter cryaerophilus ATCC 43158]
MTSPIQLDKTYGVLHTENYFSFLGFAKKVGSDEIQKIDVYLDNKLIDTILANEFIQKIDDIYDVENKAFIYNLPTQYIGQKAIISFKNNDSGEELLNSPYTLIDKNHEEFNEASFMHSLSEPLSEELKNMYKSNCVGFLATKENLEDEEFVEFINEIIRDFPEYDFKALYFDKNSIKEIKNKFQHNNLNFLELKNAKDIFENLEVYLSNYEKTFKDRFEMPIMNLLRYKSNDIGLLPLGLNRDKYFTLREFENQNKIYFQKLIDNLDHLGFNKDDINKYGNSFNAISFKSYSQKYSIDIDFNLDETVKKAYVYYHLKLGHKNHNYFKKVINRIKKSIEVQK